MKIKWTIITLLSLTAIAAASYWGVDVFNDNKTYQRNMQSAREAVAAHEWSDAAVYYKAARKVHVSIENRTALEQLNYLERADKEIQADNWPSALNLYSRVLETNDGVDLLNKAAKSGETYVNALKTADEKSDKVSTLKKALAKRHRNWLKYNQSPVILSKLPKIQPITRSPPLTAVLLRWPTVNLKSPTLRHQPLMIKTKKMISMKAQKTPKDNLRSFLFLK